jgi:hypothetical protein
MCRTAVLHFLSGWERRSTSSSLSRFLSFMSGMSPTLDHHFFHQTISPFSSVAIISVSVQHNSPRCLPMEPMIQVPPVASGTPAGPLPVTSWFGSNFLSAHIVWLIRKSECSASTKPSWCWRVHMHVDAILGANRCCSA